MMIPKLRVVLTSIFDHVVELQSTNELKNTHTKILQLHQLTADKTDIIWLTTTSPIYFLQISNSAFK